MKRYQCIFTIAITAMLGVVLLAQATGQDAKSAGKNAGEQSASEKESNDAHAYSGMYTFLKEGEFVQLTVEDEGHVTGFVSRYGDGTSDKGAFLDQFFKTGKLDENKLTFTTETVHGVWFEFRGTVDRGAGKNPGDEAYYVLKGTLTENSTDVSKKVTSRAREVEFKIFPQDAGPTAEPRK